MQMFMPESFLDVGFYLIPIVFIRFLLQYDITSHSKRGMTGSIDFPLVFIRIPVKCYIELHFADDGNY